MLKGCQVYLDVCIGGFELKYKTGEVSFVKRERIRVLLERGGFSLENRKTAGGFGQNGFFLLSSP
ncbi:hypothetical protein PAHAL_9G328300 [Panicum hallii]|uniref:Uncharacterized protein n=1 Tax=Panicum hallii TaxID=206008 RepID=A0A2T8I3C9_9POAL|nr:hypothetical protein PAHAL_9G328300 [Panicum hallii]